MYVLVSTYMYSPGQRPRGVLDPEDFDPFSELRSCSSLRSQILLESGPTDPCQAPLDLINVPQGCVGATLKTSDFITI